MTASGAVRVTRKARDEARSLRLSPADVEDFLSAVSAFNFAERIGSSSTGEWMYVFVPRLEGKRLYIKLVLRAGKCVVVSFHEDQAEESGE